MSQTVPTARCGRHILGSTVLTLPFFLRLCHLICRHTAQCEPVASCVTCRKLGLSPRGNSVPWRCLSTAPAGRRATGALLLLRVLSQGPHIKQAEPPQHMHTCSLTHFTLCPLALVLGKKNINGNHNCLSF